MTSKTKTSIEKNAKSVELAVQEALNELGITQDEAEIEVLDEGAKGFLGLGAKDAMVRVTKKAFDAEQLAVEFLTDVTKAMGLDVTFDTERTDENTLKVEMSGDKMGLLIGKRGDTLNALQYLTGLAVNKQTEEYTKINLDTENYRAKRQDVLVKLAKKLAATVVRTGKNITLEPMSPNERRIIHYTLQNNNKVKTYSVGDEPNRKVVIALK
ncbi:MAG: protein jag [Clostridia bacterium]|nr:protein jag [Clostridia bacterium]